MMSPETSRSVPGQSKFNMQHLSSLAQTFVKINDHFKKKNRAKPIPLDFTNCSNSPDQLFAAIAT